MLAQRGKLGGRNRGKRGRRMEEREEGKKEGRGSVKMGEQKGGGRRMEERRERRKGGKEKRER